MSQIDALNALAAELRAEREALATASEADIVSVMAAVICAGAIAGGRESVVFEDAVDDAMSLRAEVRRRLA